MKPTLSVLYAWLDRISLIDHMDLPSPRHTGGRSMEEGQEQEGVSQEDLPALPARVHTQILCQRRRGYFL